MCHYGKNPYDKMELLGVNTYGNPVSQDWGLGVKLLPAICGGGRCWGSGGHRGVAGGLEAAGEG